MKISLKLIHRIENFRVLLWQDNYLYASRGYSLYRIHAKDLIENKPVGIESVGKYNSNFLRMLAVFNRPLYRLSRAGFHALRILEDGRILAVLFKNIAILEQKDGMFKSVFKIRRGARPLGIIVTPDSHIYWGEYFDNKERDEVYVYGSHDSGKTWKVAYTFPRRTIRHIHNIAYDRFDDCFWVVAGDEDREPRILRISRDWKTEETVLAGDQQARAATLIIREEGIYYATDTPHEQNNIYLIERNGSRKRLYQTPGPSMWSCNIGDAMFFSTASEPGKYYHEAACIYGSVNGKEWQKLVEWQKDSLHPTYFQFGNIVLPFGGNDYSLLAATGVAVKKEDGVANIWKIERS